MRKMTTSSKGLQMIKGFENLRLFAYRCPAGVPTIGYGHTKGVKMGQAITEKQAEDYLKQDVTPIERYLNDVGVNFRQEQFDALVSWIFNLGAGNFQHSTLFKKICTDAPDGEIAEQILKWVNANGKPLTGLKRRRIAEANMFLGTEAYKLDKDNNIIKV
jgi:lysozyme